MCSFAPKIVASAEKIPFSFFGGWIDGALEEITKQNDIEVGICYPQVYSLSLVQGQFEGIKYFGIYSKKLAYGYEQQLDEPAKEVITAFNPDVIHIWGAEFPFAYAIVKVAPNSGNIVCSIQGLCSYIEKHYFSHMPIDVIKSYTFRDFIKRDNLVQQKKKYMKRGLFEKKIIEKIGHVIGRTDWDRACVQGISLDTKYHFCNETLREVFYVKQNQWDYEKCEKHSIFVSQVYYPIKGFHILLEAFAEILKMYPDAKIYSAGTSPFDISMFRIGSYQAFLKRRIKALNIEEKVIFLGDLSQEEMCSAYLNSNVFVSASCIENSPNSVGEAMLLGMPVVASYVGGTKNLLTDEKEGFLYQSDAPYMLAYYIGKVFDMKDGAKHIGQNAYEHAMKTHDPLINKETLLNVYKDIFREGNVSHC